MRTYRATSFISNIVPSLYMTLSVVLLLGVIFVYNVIRCNHKRGVRSSKMHGIIMIALGVFIILIGFLASRDATKYTVGAEETTAVVTDVYIDIPTDGSSTYLYTIEFTYKDEVVSVKMSPSHRMSLEQGDTLQVYFYPDEIGRTEYPIVVAVDMEKKLAWDNMRAGFISCVIGVFILILSYCKLGLRENGFRTNAQIVQVRNSNRDSGQRVNIENLLVCEGRNPVTGMRQTFKTHGYGGDFCGYNEGEIVPVFIHKRFGKIYMIDT